MGDLDPLPLAGKHNRVITNHITTAQCCKADGAVFTCTGMAIARSHRNLIKLHTTALGRGFTQAKCRARRGIDLVFVVHFNDFDVGDILVKDACYLLDQRKGQIHTDTHIRGKDDRGLFGGNLQLVFLIIRQARGANHKDLAGFCSQFCMFHRRGRGREINHRVNSLKQRLGIIANHNAAFFQTGDQGHVLADERTVGQVRAATNFTALGLGGFIHQHPSHTASTSNNPDLHFRSPPGKQVQICNCFNTRP